MSYIGFNKLKSEIAAKGGVSNPGAVAAAIGRKKYGKKAFQHAAATGHKMKNVPAKRKAAMSKFVKKHSG